MDETFLRSVREGRCEEVLSMLQEDESLLLSTDDAGNTALHVAIIAQREAMVGILLNQAKNASSPDVENAFVGLANGDGKTALDLSLQRKQRRISWTLIQRGGARFQGFRGERISTNSLFQALPEFENGNNFMHVYARNNYALQIKEYLDGCADGDRLSFVRVCLSPNSDGDFPAMVAARRRNKEALMALLQPFIVFPDRRELDVLLHHENEDGQRLITYVSHYDKSLSAVHGVLVELETFAHGHDSYEVKECFRASMGSTMAAKLSTELFKRIRHRSTPAWRSLLLVKILGLSFLVRSSFLVLDMFTDVLLVREYFQQWGVEQDTKDSGVSFPGKVSTPADPCKRTEYVQSLGGEVLGTHVWATGNVTLGCYPGAIDGRTRFFSTLFFLLLPFTLYFFEVLRFRIFSKFLERCYPASFAAKFVVRPLGNTALW